MADLVVRRAADGVCAPLADALGESKVRDAQVPVSVQQQVLCAQLTLHSRLAGADIRSLLKCVQFARQTCRWKTSSHFPPELFSTWLEISVHDAAGVQAGQRSHHASGIEARGDLAEGALEVEVVEQLAAWAGICARHRCQPAEA